MSVALTFEVSYNTSKQPSYRTNEAPFGDGYKQYTLDGINFDEEVWNADFIPINTINANNLELTLLQSVNGTNNYLLWTPPGESTAKYYTATQVQKFSVGPDKWKITAQLRREFPLT
jgi:phage-related protein